MLLDEDLDRIVCAATRLSASRARDLVRLVVSAPACIAHAPGLSTLLAARLAAAGFPEVAVEVRAAQGPLAIAEAEFGV